MMHSDDSWDVELDWPSDQQARSSPASSRDLRSQPREARRSRTRDPRLITSSEATAELMQGFPMLPQGTPRGTSRAGQFIEVAWVPTGDRFVVAEQRDPPAQGSRHLFQPGSRQAASIRILSHRLKQAGNPQAILITSARAREGRTTCALNLARAFAEDTSAHLMLIEADSSHPALHAALGGPPPECLSSQLVVHRDEPDRPWKVIAALSPNLHVLAMSPTPQTTAFNASIFGDLMLALREERYSHIVVDSPPVLGSAEANALAEHCDAVLFTAWGGKSKSTELENAALQLATRKLLGVVLLNV